MGKRNYIGPKLTHSEDQKLINTWIPEERVSLHMIMFVHFQASWSPNHAWFMIWFCEQVELLNKFHSTIFVSCSCRRNFPDLKVFKDIPGGNGGWIPQSRYWSRVVMSPPLLAQNISAAPPDHISTLCRIRAWQIVGRQDPPRLGQESSFKWVKMDIHTSRYCGGRPQAHIPKSPNTISYILPAPQKPISERRIISIDWNQVLM